ncbi:AAA family ATPase [Paraburkholderia sp. BCC1884]|uniref:AAA family ATPase n=1 Tax=Paraburkholderia sp. BCC1884 TaxID=2562668 RepID=UPI00164324EE|nr:AAA family ATPase [Paraburkholderia sp. BCC1884]
MKSNKSQHPLALIELCRHFLASGHGSPATVTWLAQRLLAADDQAVAGALEALVSEAAVKAPSERAGVLSLTVAGEPLTRSARMPVDRETASPLATIVYEKQLPSTPPVLPRELMRALDAFVLEWRRADELARVGIAPANSCLLYGEPGTGKTQLALWLSGQLGLPVILARLDGLMSSFLGTTSRNIGNLFAFANRHRAVLLLDEFDAIAKLRDDPNEIGEIKRVVNTLLQNIDERKGCGITIGITNHPQLLDPAIWRRFEMQIAISVPEADARQIIVKRNLEPLVFGDAEVRFISWVMDGASGAEIEDFVRSLKKSLILIEGVQSIVKRLRGLAFIHAARIKPLALDALKLSDRSLARALNSDYNFSITELAQLFRVNRTTISRWIT